MNELKTKIENRIEQLGRSKEQLAEWISKYVLAGEEISSLAEKLTATTIEIKTLKRVVEDIGNCS